MKTLTKGLKALTTEAEQCEMLAVGTETVKLRRSFNQSIPAGPWNGFQGGYVKFWRVIGPKGHRSLNSDLSVQGLKEWGIIK